MGKSLASLTMIDWSDALRNQTEKLITDRVNNLFQEK
jgi:hypothetical protein